MRLAGQAKAGFYPANPHAIASLAKHLQQLPPIEGKPLLTTQIIDPCAGEGAAVQQLAAALEIEEDHVYCVELDAGRVEQVKERHAEGPPDRSCHVHRRVHDHRLLIRHRLCEPTVRF